MQQRLLIKKNLSIFRHQRKLLFILLIVPILTCIIVYTRQTKTSKISANIFPGLSADFGPKALCSSLSNVSDAGTIVMIHVTNSILADQIAFNLEMSHLKNIQLVVVDKGSIPNKSKDKDGIIFIEVTSEILPFEVDSEGLSPYSASYSIYGFEFRAMKFLSNGFAPIAMDSAMGSSSFSQMMTTNALVQFSVAQINGLYPTTPLCDLGGFELQVFAFPVREAVTGTNEDDFGFLNILSLVSYLIYFWVIIYAIMTDKATHYHTNLIVMGISRWAMYLSYFLTFIFIGLPQILLLSFAAMTNCSFFPAMPYFFLINLLFVTNTIALAMWVAACCTSIIIGLLFGTIIAGSIAALAMLIPSLISPTAATSIHLTVFPSTYYFLINNATWLADKVGFNMDSASDLFGVLGDRAYNTKTLLFCLTAQSIAFSIGGMYLTAVVRQSDYIIAEKWYFPLILLQKWLRKPCSDPKTIIREFSDPASSGINELMGSILSSDGDHNVDPINTLKMVVEETRIETPHTEEIPFQSSVPPLDQLNNFNSSSEENNPFDSGSESTNPFDAILIQDEQYLGHHYYLQSGEDHLDQLFPQEEYLFEGRSELQASTGLYQCPQQQMWNEDDDYHQPQQEQQLPSTRTNSTHIRQINKKSNTTDSSFPSFVTTPAITSLHASDSLLFTSSTNISPNNYPSEAARALQDADPPRFNPSPSTEFHIAQYCRDHIIQYPSPKEKNSASITLKHITKTFPRDSFWGHPHKVLDDLNLRFYSGQIHAILGRNGTGKTLILSILAKMTEPTEGSVFIHHNNRTRHRGVEWDGDIIPQYHSPLETMLTNPIIQSGLESRAKNNHNNSIFSPTDSGIFETGPDFTPDGDYAPTLGVCFQHESGCGHLTVYENLQFFSQIKESVSGFHLSTSQRDIEIAQLLKLTQLEHKANEYLDTLSGGQKRKVSVAIALLHNPQIVLMDNLTAGADVHSQRTIWALLEKQKANRTVIFATQSLQESLLADRISILRNGAVACTGSAVFLKEHYNVGNYILSMDKEAAIVDHGWTLTNNPFETDTLTTTTTTTTGKQKPNRISSNGPGNNNHSFNEPPPFSDFNAPLPGYDEATGLDGSNPALPGTINPQTPRYGGYNQSTATATTRLTADDANSPSLAELAALSPFQHNSVDVEDDPQSTNPKDENDIMPTLSIDHHALLMKLPTQEFGFDIQKMLVLKSQTPRTVSYGICVGYEQYLPTLLEYLDLWKSRIWINNISITTTTLDDVFDQVHRGDADLSKWTQQQGIIDRTIMTPAVADVCNRCGEWIATERSDSTQDNRDTTNIPLCNICFEDIAENNDQSLTASLPDDKVAPPLTSTNRTKSCIPSQPNRANAIDSLFPSLTKSQLNLDETCADTNDHPNPKDGTNEIATNPSFSTKSIDEELLSTYTPKALSRWYDHQLPIISRPRALFWLHIKTIWYKKHLTVSYHLRRSFLPLVFLLCLAMALQILPGIRHIMGSSVITPSNSNISEGHPIISFQSDSFMTSPLKPTNTTRQGEMLNIMANSADTSTEHTFRQVISQLFASTYTHFTQHIPADVLDNIPLAPTPIQLHLSNDENLQMSGDRQHPLYWAYTMQQCEVRFQGKDQLLFGVDLGFDTELDGDTVGGNGNNNNGNNRLGLKNNDLPDYALTSLKMTLFHNTTSPLMLVPMVNNYYSLLWHLHSRIKTGFEPLNNSSIQPLDSRQQLGPPTIQVKKFDIFKFRQSESSPTLIWFNKRDDSLPINDTLPTGLCAILMAAILFSLSYEHSSGIFTLYTMASGERFTRVYYIASYCFDVLAFFLTITIFFAISKALQYTTMDNATQIVWGNLPIALSQSISLLLLTSITSISYCYLAHFALPTRQYLSQFALTIVQLFELAVRLLAMPHAAPYKWSPLLQIYIYSQENRIGLWGRGPSDEFPRLYSNPCPIIFSLIPTILFLIILFAKSPFVYFKSLQDIFSAATGLPQTRPDLNIVTDRGQHRSKSHLVAQNKTDIISNRIISGDMGGSQYALVVHGLRKVYPRSISGWESCRHWFYSRECCFPWFCWRFNPNFFRSLKRFDWSNYHQLTAQRTRNEKKKRRVDLLLKKQDEYFNWRAKQEKLLKKQQKQHHQQKELSIKELVQDSISTEDPSPSLQLAQSGTSNQPSNNLSTANIADYNTLAIPTTNYDTPDIYMDDNLSDGGDDDEDEDGSGGIASDFLKPIVALQSLFLAIRKHSVTALLGTNGSGKSTFMSILASETTPTPSLETASSQTLFQNNTNLFETPQADSLQNLITNHSSLTSPLRISYCPQSTRFHLELTPRQTIVLFAGLYAIHPVIYPNLIPNILSATLLTAHADVPCADLSPGHLRLLSIAIALIAETDLTLLDEPSATLDPTARRQIHRLLQDMLSTRTIIISSHLLEEVEQLSDTVVILNHGELVAYGSKGLLKEQQREQQEKRQRLGGGKEEEEEEEQQQRLQQQERQRRKFRDPSFSKYHGGEKGSINPNLGHRRVQFSHFNRGDETSLTSDDSGSSSNGSDTDDNNDDNYKFTNNIGQNTIPIKKNSNNLRDISLNNSTSVMNYTIHVKIRAVNKSQLIKSFLLSALTKVPQPQLETQLPPIYTFDGIPVADSQTPTQNEQFIKQQQRDATWQAKQHMLRRNQRLWKQFLATCRAKGAFLLPQQYSNRFTICVNTNLFTTSQLFTVMNSCQAQCEGDISNYLCSQPTIDQLFANVIEHQGGGVVDGNGSGSVSVESVGGLGTGPLHAARNVVM